MVDIERSIKRICKIYETVNDYSTGSCNTLKYIIKAQKYRKGKNIEMKYVVTDKNTGIEYVVMHWPSKTKYAWSIKKREQK